MKKLRNEPACVLGFLVVLLPRLHREERDGAGLRRVSDLQRPLLSQDTTRIHNSRSSFSAILRSRRDDLGAAIFAHS